MSYELVVVGSSWGGLQALGTLFRSLTPSFRTPIVVAQHRAPDSTTSALISVLGLHGSIKVQEAEDKARIEPGSAYLAPPDYHLLVESGRFALSVEEKVQFSRPSIDVLFESAADAYGPALIAVILTGANEDGARGIARVKSLGGYTIVQDPETAVKRSMPDAAIATGAVDSVDSIEGIASTLERLCVVPFLKERGEW